MRIFNPDFALLKKKSNTIIKTVKRDADEIEKVDESETNQSVSDIIRITPRKATAKK